MKTITLVKMDLESELSECKQVKRSSSNNESSRCCSSCCHFKCNSAIATKGVVFLLVWHMAFRLLQAFLLGNYIEMSDKKHDLKIAWNLYYALCIVFPFAGWIADTWTGRYKAIICGTIVCLIAALVSVTGFTLMTVNVSVAPIVFAYVVQCLNMLGVTAFLANFIPFATDQLVGATSADLSHLVHWYAWERSVGDLVMSVVQVSMSQFLSQENSGTFYSPLYYSITYGIYAFLLSFMLIVLVLDLLCGKRWLVTKSNLSNPIMLIFNVLNYARKNKSARNRSAFTYIDEEQPSRLDLANTKFGGPFTEEQVEDVKTTLRLLSLIVLMNLISMVQTTESILPQHLIHDENNWKYRLIIGSKLFVDALVGLLAIPAYNFIILPLFHKYIPNMLKRIGMGMCLYLLALVANIAIDTTGQVMKWSQTNYTHNESTIACLLQSNVSDDSQLPFEYYWTLIPTVLTSLGNLILKITSLEFTLAQSPAGMKGLLFGLWFAVVGFADLIGYNLPYLFAIIPSTALPACEFYYFLTMLLLSSTCFVLFLITSRCYKLRMRQRTVNIHLIVEEHYERYLDQEEEYLKAAGITESYDTRLAVKQQQLRIQL